MQQALDVIGALKPHLHNINLDSLKGEIKHKYDKDNSAYLLWGKRKGERGYGADQIAQELQEKGIFIEAINEADIFFEIDAQYSSIVKGFGIKAPDVDDYCSLAAVRNNDNSAAMAQGVLDRVDKFGSALMKPTIRRRTAAI